MCFWNLFCNWYRLMMLIFSSMMVKKFVSALCAGQIIVSQCLLLNRVKMG